MSVKLPSPVNDEPAPVLADPNEVRRYIARLRNYGYDTYDIAVKVRTKFRCPMSQRGVESHLTAIRKWDAEAARLDKEEAITEELAQLRLLRQKAYRAFDKSSQPLTKQAVVNGEVKDLVIERGADARFLTVLLGIVDRISELKDLKPAQKTEVRAAVTSYDWNTFLAMPTVTSNDPVETAFAALEAMPRPVESATNPGETVTEAVNDGV
jgi:hypothetical protein